MNIEVYNIKDSSDCRIYGDVTDVLNSSDSGSLFFR